MKVNYHELFDWKKVIDKIYYFLGVENIYREPSLKKRSKKNIEDNVMNYDEIKATIKGTEFEKYI